MRKQSALTKMVLYHLIIDVACVISIIQIYTTPTTLIMLFVLLLHDFMIVYLCLSMYTYANSHTIIHLCLLLTIVRANINTTISCILKSCEL
jgi:hypothetical protein